MIGFEPERGVVLVPPPGTGRGSWAGAPGAYRDGRDLYVTYRLRRPPPFRGFEMRIAAVRGGRVEVVRAIHKEDLAAESIERSALVRVDGRWRLYLSYVDAGDRRWRIAMIDAANIDDLDARDATVVLHPDALGLSAVKDPWLRQVDGLWHMFVSCGRSADASNLHASGDALSTGIVRSESGLATSEDGLHWRWQGVVFEPSEAGWDRSTARLTSAVRDGDGWSAYYDGSGTTDENYEERCGIARSRDLRTWSRLSVAGPAVGTARGARGVRYVEVTDAGDIFFEHTRADGAHELRALVASAD
jgi:hypothetical protein